MFDCDGVLVDSERMLVRIDQYVFRQLGWDASIDEIASRFVGKAEDEHQAEIRKVLGPVSDDWRSPFDELYETAMREQLTAVDGVESALQAIALPMAVASNSRRGTLHNSLTTTGLIKYFDGRLVSVDDVRAGKPEPHSYLRAAQLLSVSPAECIAVEDSPTGVRAAVAAGMHVLGYSGGLTPLETLEEAGASRLFTSMAELPRLVSEWS